jgi:hypothetical protein
VQGAHVHTVQLYKFILTPFLPVYLGAVKAAAVDVREEHGVHQGGLKTSRNIYIRCYKKVCDFPLLSRNVSNQALPAENNSMIPRQGDFG